MGRIEREKEIDSILINKELLESLFKIIRKSNPERIELKTEINFYSEGEKTSYGDLKDFFETSITLEKPKSFSMRIYPSNKKDKYKTLQLYFRINNKENRNYYQLVGYDEGSILTCEKQIKALLDRYKNWYYKVYKLPTGIVNLLKIAIFLSVSFLVYKMLTTYFININNDLAIGIAVIFFFITGWYLSRIGPRLFPKTDFQFKKTERKEFWRYVLGLIILGLIINLIWAIITYLIKRLSPPL